MSESVSGEGSPAPPSPQKYLGVLTALSQVAGQGSYSLGQVLVMLRKMSYKLSYFICIPITAATFSMPSSEITTPLVMVIRGIRSSCDTCLPGLGD